MSAWCAPALLLFSLAAAVFGQPTYSKEVSRILQQKCQMCHRPNDIAPFALMNYEDASTWAEDIQLVISNRIMPPWKPVAGYGDFRDSYALTDGERQTILDWVAAGAPAGDPADLPEPQTATGDWQLGDPDVVVQMAEPYTPARGKDVYRCFVVSNPFEETAYVKAVDVLPGNRLIVHHVILYIDEKNQSPALDDKEDGPGYTCFGGPGFDVSVNSMLGGWAPGTLPKPLPDGVAVQIPKGGRLVMQVHYFPIGRTGEDTTRVGLYFSKEPVERRLFYIPIYNDRFEIPAGDASYDVSATFTVPPLFDAKIVQIFPHMHVLGRKIKVEYTPQGKETSPLIYIDNWEFNWQGFYNYKEAVSIPAFTRLRVTCNYDNSEGNPANPNNPLKNVRWGEGTQDEMCIAFLGVTLDNENLLPFQKPRRTR
jgi:hypothetical protein